MRSLAFAAVALALVGCSQAADDSSAAASSDINESAASSSSFYRPSPALAAVLDPIVARGQLTDADYVALKPMLEALPGRASADTRAMVDVSFRLTVAPDARTALNTQIERWGYRLEGAANTAAAIASNVTEEDDDFTLICNAVESCANETGYLLGMIDGGFRLDHPATEGRFWTNPKEIAGNNLDDDGNGLVDDVHGYNFNQGSGDLAKEGFGGSGDSAHGLNTAAIALRGTKRISLIGTTAQNSSFIAKSMTYLAAHGVKVVSFSLGTWGDGIPLVMQVIDANPDVLFLESAGNSGKELKAGDDNLASNARPNFMKVGAADLDLSRQSTSNFSGTLVDVAAIGPQFSAVPFDWFPAGYVLEGKTSQSTPFVANVAARILMLAPKLSAVQVRSLLTASSDELPAWKGVVVANGVVSPLRAARVAAFHALTSDGMSSGEAFAKLAVPADEQPRVTKLAATLR